MAHISDGLAMLGLGLGFGLILAGGIHPLFVFVGYGVLALAVLLTLAPRRPPCRTLDGALTDKGPRALRGHPGTRRGNCQE